MSDLPASARAALLKSAATRAIGAMQVTVAPASDNGWRMPEGDELVHVDGGGDVGAVFVRTRLAEVDGETKVTAALSDAAGYVARDDAGHPRILPTVVGDDVDAVRQQAVTAAAAMMLGEHLLAIQVPGPVEPAPTV